MLNVPFCHCFTDKKNPRVHSYNLWYLHKFWETRAWTSTDSHICTVFKSISCHRGILFGAIWGNTCWIWPGNDQWGLNVVHLPSKCIVQKSDSGPKALISWGECSKKWCFGFSLNPGNVDRRSSLCSATQEINGLFCMFWCHSQFNYIFKQHQNSPWTLSFWDIMHGKI